MIELGYNFLHWFKRHYFLYIFGLLECFKPLNPFLYEMMVTTKNITEQQYNEDIRPISAYTTAITALLIFLVINFCMFNYIYVISFVGGLVVSVFVWQSDTLPQLQVAEGFLGCVIATEIIYYASIYVCENTNGDFASLTAYIRAVPLGARVLGSILAQILVTNKTLSLHELAFLSVPATGQAICLVFHLPVMVELDEPPEPFLPKMSWFKSKFKETFSNKHVLKWSLWSAFTMCGHARVSAMMQPMWREAQQEDGEMLYNGAVDGIAAFLAFLGVLLCGMMKGNWRYSNALLLVTSLVQTCLLMALASVESVWDSNICYIVLEIVYHFVMTSISAMIAESIHRKGSFGIVFSFIGLVSAIFNVIFTCVLNERVISLTFQEHFVVYGGYHLVIAMLVISCWFSKL
ncbi:hypothetical protein MTP99_009423 [Tenebrio molitor]|jgi:thiamine transporter 2/3|uniref:folate-like transporter 3 n=1 Tax=Tenebrio molitor TaxID=7067 RepID=UPI0026FFF5A8|nr:hypothetical protein MTP99_009423 [Tenebrio molitor]